MSGCQLVWQRRGRVGGGLGSLHVLGCRIHLWLRLGGRGGCLHSGASVDRSLFLRNTGFWRRLGTFSLTFTGAGVGMFGDRVVRPRLNCVW